MEPFSIKLPIPPTANHAYAPGPHGRRYLTAEARAWAAGCRVLVGHWHPPERTPLVVTIVLEMERRLLRRTDIDGPIKLLLDSVIGSRRDVYVDHLYVTKAVGDGWAVVRVDAGSKVG